MQERAEARGEMARAAVVIPEQAAEQERSSEEDVDWGELARTQAAEHARARAERRVQRVEAAQAQAEHMRQHRRGDTEMQRPQAEQDALRRRTVRSVRRVEQEVR
jgi:hypothetical protein